MGWWWVLGRSCEQIILPQASPSMMTKGWPHGTSRARNSQRKVFSTTTPKPTFIYGLYKIMSMVGEIKSQETQPIPVNGLCFLLRRKLNRRALCASQRAIESTWKYSPLFLTCLQPRLPDLANKNTAHPVKFFFQINNEKNEHKYVLCDI